MITYGPTMQGKENIIPKEVAAWLTERDTQYPKIDFRVNCYEPHPSEKAGFEVAAKKYSIIYLINTPQGGVGQATFPYLSESWNIRIIGGLDKKGEIADPRDPDYIKNFGGPLPRALRDKIAALPDLATLEKLGDKAVAALRG